VTDLRFDHLDPDDELTAALEALAAARPELTTLTVGRSSEGRTIWLPTVTNAATGSHAARPDPAGTVTVTERPARRA